MSWESNSIILPDIYVQDTYKTYDLSYPAILPHHHHNLQSYTIQIIHKQKKISLDNVLYVM